MTKISLIHPTDQPLGKRRLLQELETTLQNNRFSDFRLIVAYARSGPLLRLKKLLTDWRRSGKTTSAVIGLDQQGTSREALELALDLFDCVYITQEPGVVFHPKIYLFQGRHHARAFVGSSNLTVGGTEKNFEATICLDFHLPTDCADLHMFESSWCELLPKTCPATVRLNPTQLTKLVASNVVVGEKDMPASAHYDDAVNNRHGKRPKLPIRPESPLPRKTFAGVGGASTRKSGKSMISRKHVIQIKPKRNGEIFLSVSAVLQNPEFFYWPFTGKTTPKFSTNPSYPQLEPDPVVNIAVFAIGPEPILTLSQYKLNTVYYELKSEIRITAAPLYDVVPEYSVMIMERSRTPGINYEITIHTPDSPDYDVWVSACNQQMPGGGETPRKYGWF